MTTRIIGRLDIKGDNLIKGVHLEGLRVIGKPEVYAKNYYEQGIDELIYIDIVASLYGRNKLTEVINRAAREIFVPLTVGGGVRSIHDVDDLLKSGADKVAINTAAVNNPNLITEVSSKFGSQCMMLSIEAKKISENKWEIYTECGRERTHLDVIDWIKKGIDLGAGEILLTSIDQEGTRKGFDTDLLKQVCDISSVPVIVSGGYGSENDIKDAVNVGANAVAIADALHYERASVQEIKKAVKEMNIKVREIR